MSGAALAQEGDQRRKVLVVEDDLDAVQAYAAGLVTLGHECRFAINAFTGLDIARAWRPHLVLLDVVLPGMDGLELAARLKAEANTREARLIAISGFDDPGYRRRAGAAGCEAYFVKPITLQLLEQILA